MKASEIEKGGKYIAKVSGVLTTVRVDEIRETSRGRMAAGGYTYGTATVYDVTNMKTGRRTTFRSAAKFRRVVGDRTELLKRIDQVTSDPRKLEQDAWKRQSEPTTAQEAVERKPLVEPTPESEAFEQMFNEDDGYPVGYHPSETGCY